ncbi:MAG: HTTM domain-containing protein, partial [Polyangiaceae bacterium]
MTERSINWFPHARSPGLCAAQAALIVSGLILLSGRWIWAAGIAATAARATEALVYFPLNDFFFCSVVTLLLAHSAGGPFASNRRPMWVRHALLAQFGATYIATAILKLNPDWLSGGHLFVRSQYLLLSRGWPYPAWLEASLASLSADAFASKMAIAAELTLGGVLLARRPYWLGVVLVLGLHAVGTFMTNVWFFSATMVAGVLLLLPRGLHERADAERRVMLDPR